MSREKFFVFDKYGLVQMGLSPRGAHVEILTGMLVLFFLGLNLAKFYFSGLANFSAIFSRFHKISAICLGQ